jgi:hypothetical protein
MIWKYRYRILVGVILLLSLCANAYLLRHRIWVVNEVEMP